MLYSLSSRRAKSLSQVRSQLAASNFGYVRPLFGSFEAFERSLLRYYSPMASSFDKPTSITGQRIVLCVECAFRLCLEHVHHGVQRK